eukprot:5942466-Pyramimonas_sp.AAC.1
MDRRSARPKPELTMEEAGPPLVDGKPTLAQQRVLPWSESCTNQMDRAAYLFGNVENFWTQKIIINCLQPTSEYHSRSLGLPPSL